MSDALEATTPEYPETADIETASENYARRFSGPAGEWMLAVQERIVSGWVAPDGSQTVLDVGGGHGQLAVPLARQGVPVTVLGSAASCADRIRGSDQAERIRFSVGNVVELPFEDGAFDVVICIRLLAHCERWPALVAELCRVARQSVIVDYPTYRSLNCLSALLFGAKKRLEGNTRPYKLFHDREVQTVFARQGFERDARRPEFFVPMVAHRLLKCPVCSNALETVAAAIGLRAWLGSPVLARFLPAARTENNRSETPI